VHHLLVAVSPLYLCTLGVAKVAQLAFVRDQYLLLLSNHTFVTAERIVAITEERVAIWVSVAECLSLFLRIRMVPCSNLVLKTVWSKGVFSWFFSAPSGKCRNSAVAYTMTGSFHIFLSSLIILLFDAVLFELLKASINKL
jgi:hypothetical protein